MKVKGDSMKRIISGIVVTIFTFVSFSFAQIDSAPSAASGGKGLGTQVLGSDKISLDLKGMDVVEVIKMLATKGNLNIVLSGDVKGRVTIFFEKRRHNGRL